MRVFATTYKTLPHVVARIAELTMDNTILGTSDDRVTELRAIHTELRGELGGNDDDVRMLLQIARELAQYDAPVLPIEKEFEFLRSFRARRDTEMQRRADALAAIATDLKA